MGNIGNLYEYSDTTLCDQVRRWLATGRWFSPGTPVSSTNKTDRHDITVILLKVGLITINQTCMNTLLHFLLSLQRMRTFLLLSIMPYKKNWKKEIFKEMSCCLKLRYKLIYELEFILFQIFYHVHVLLIMLWDFQNNVTT